MPAAVHGIPHARAIAHLYFDERCGVPELAEFFGVRADRVRYVVDQFTPAPAPVTEGTIA